MNLSWTRVRLPPPPWKENTWQILAGRRTRVAGRADEGRRPEETTEDGRGPPQVTPAASMERKPAGGTGGRKRPRGFGAAEDPLQTTGARDGPHFLGRKIPVRTKAYFLGTILPVVLIADVITKRWAMSALANYQSSELFGGLIPLNLAFNRGAAFGLSIGNDPRWFFIPVTLVALALLIYLLAKTEGSDRFRIFALSLVMAGAIGNLIDRVRWNEGVVDFIGPINLGFMDWPIFNVADMAISCGAVALAISFWMEETEKPVPSPEVKPEPGGETTS